MTIEQALDYIREFIEMQSARCYEHDAEACATIHEWCDVIVALNKHYAPRA